MQMHEMTLARRLLLQASFACSHPGYSWAALVLIKSAVDIRARLREQRCFSAGEYDRRTGVER